MKPQWGLELRKDFMVMCIDGLTAGMMAKWPDLSMKAMEKGRS